MYKHVLHLFRRDLRIVDNTSLLFAASASRVSVGFIFDPAQVHKNRYKSEKALSFLLGALEELAGEVGKHGGVLNFWCGEPEKVLKRVLKNSDIDCVTVNADYTPFSKQRDEKIAALCEKEGVAFRLHHDALLTPPGAVVTGGGTPFKVFTPFYKAASACAVVRPKKMGKVSFAGHLLSGARNAIDYEYAGVAPRRSGGLFIAPGRRAALAMLKKLDRLVTYEKERDIPANESGTSHLSAHNKFGTVSIREVYWAIQENLGVAGAPLIRSLYWRDFFTHVLAAKPTVLGHAYQEQFEHVAWENNEEKFAAWCEGRTGFPIVDAGMRQLNQTGFMHNRVRMIAASFLVKDLHVDWRWGERYFAQHLTDYDPAVNNGNWQWVASTGCDAQPYFRIFNPWLQQKKFDPEARYIKHWVTELALFSAAAIHAAEKKPLAGYPRPMVEHSVESKKALAAYKKAASAL